MNFFRPSFAKLPYSLYRRDGEICKKYLNSGGQACAFYCLLKFSPGVSLPKRQWNAIAISFRNFSGLRKDFLLRD